MSDVPPRKALALHMVSTLPTWGKWVASMRDVETPYGRIGFRPSSIMWILRKGLVPPENHSTTGIASYLGIQNSVVTRACERLEQLGLLERTTDPADRRRSRVALTQTGIDASIHIEDLYLRSMLKAMEELDDDTIAELQRSVSLLAQIGEQIFPHPPGS